MRNELQRAIKHEMAAEMQTNQYLVAASRTGKCVNNPATLELALQLTLESSAQLRAACFIFGDTFDNQPIAKAHEVLLLEGFELYSNDLDNKGTLYVHESMGITARVTSNNGLLEQISLICDFDVDTSLITPDSMVGLGAFGEIVNGRFNCIVEATCGLATKMHVLRRFATDGSLVVD